MDIFPIRTEEDYDAALARIDMLMNAEAGTPEGDELDIMVTLVEAYEAKHYPIPACDPVEAIKFRMEQSGMSVADMQPYIGPPNRVYEG